jgi:hypothetical protein
VRSAGTKNLVVGASLVLFAALLFSNGSLLAQGLAQSTPSRQTLPDAPVPQQQTQNGEKERTQGGWRKRVAILGKQSLFFPELAHQTGPLSSRQKLQLAVDETLAPSHFVSAAFTSSISQASNSLPGYGQGWDAYGKRFGASVGTNASRQVFGTFLLASLLHQDPRYFVKLHGPARSRILYAVSRVIVTRTDGGGHTLNLSKLGGGLMAEGLANTYLPDNERTTGQTFSRFGAQVGWSALGNVVREYWPSIFKTLGLRRVVPDYGADLATDKADSNSQKTDHK